MVLQVDGLKFKVLSVQVAPQFDQSKQRQSNPKNLNSSKMKITLD